METLIHDMLANFSVWIMKPTNYWQRLQIWLYTDTTIYSSSILPVSLTTSMLIGWANRTTITGYVQVTLSPNHYYYPFYSVPFIAAVLCFEMLSNALHCSLMPVFPFVPQNIALAYFEADGFAVSPLSTCVIDA